jgi:hypothetical protein
MDQSSFPVPGRHVLPSLHQINTQIQFLEQNKLNQIDSDKVHDEQSRNYYLTYNKYLSINCPHYTSLHNHGYSQYESSNTLHTICM